MNESSEAELALHLRKRANASKLTPDLEDVIRRSSRARGGGVSSRRRPAFVVGFAAAALVITAVVAVVAHRSVRQLRTAGMAPLTLPGNGSIAFEINGTVKLIDPATHHIATLDAPGLGAQPPAWGPSGRQFVYSDGRDVTVFDTTTRTTRLVGECFHCGFAWSPDGATIAAAQGGSVLLFDAGRSSGTPRTVAVGTAVSDLNWSPDSGRLYYIVDSRQVDALSMSTLTPTTLIPAAAPSHRYNDFLGLAISPDGEDLALLTARPATDSSFIHVQLMTAKIDGSNTRIVQDDLGICFCNLTPGVTWSPDGTTLALAIPTHQISGGFQLYLANPDGTNIRPLGEGTSQKVSWQPIPGNSTGATTSSVIAPPDAPTQTTTSTVAATTTPASQRPRNGVIILAEGLGLSQFDPSGEHTTIPLPTTPAYWRAPSWAPDGRRFAFADDTHIKVEDITTGAVTEVATCTDGACGHPAWSPDGLTIAYPDDKVISLAPADGSTTQPSASLTDLGGTPVDLNWTPDGQAIIYGLTLPSPSFGLVGIASVARDGSSHRTIVSTDSAPLFSDAALSPDGTKIAFLGATLDAATSVFSLEVMTVNVDGSAMTTIRHIGSCGCAGLTPGLAWSPDGTELAVVSPKVNVTATGDVDRRASPTFWLYILSADGSTLTPTDRTASGTPSWQPIPS
jgi:Tol biopolymer transport system component